MTSYKKDSFSKFWKARYLRLLPLFFLCTLIIQAFKSSLSWVRPDRMTHWPEYLLTNVCLPTLDIPCAMLFRNDYTFVDGAFWSLLVEFRYYFLFSVLWYFLRLRKSVIFVLIAASFLSFYTQVNFTNRLNDFFLYLPFFSFGMSFYEFENGSKKIGFFGGFFSLAAFFILGLFEVQHISISLTHANLPLYFMCFVVFTALMLLFKNRNNLTFPALTHLAVLSYPIYLLHQEMGLIIIKLFSPDIGVLASRICAAAMAIALSYLLDWFVNYSLTSIRAQFKSTSDKV